MKYYFSDNEEAMIEALKKDSFFNSKYYILNNPECFKKQYNAL